MCLPVCKQFHSNYLEGLEDLNGLVVCYYKSDIIDKWPIYRDSVSRLEDRIPDYINNSVIFVKVKYIEM